MDGNGRKQDYIDGEVGGNTRYTQPKQRRSLELGQPFTIILEWLKGWTFVRLHWSFTGCGLLQEGVVILGTTQTFLLAFSWRLCSFTFSGWRNKHFSPKGECEWHIHSIHYRHQQPEIVGNVISVYATALIYKSTQVEKCRWFSGLPGT